MPAQKDSDSLTSFHTPDSRLLDFATLMAIVRDSPCAVIETDGSGAVQLWTAQASEMFGFQTADVLGRSLPIQASDRVRPPPPSGVRRNPLTHPDRREFETELIAADGSPVAVSIWHAPLHDDQGRETGTVSIVSDRREQADLQQALLQSIEHEARRLGRALHDSLSQQLLGAAFAAKSLANQSQREGLELTDQLNDLASLINDAVRETRTLSQSLNPIDLDPSSLGSALAALAERFSSEASETTCTFVSRKPVLISDQMSAMHVYRIAHEAVASLAEEEAVSRIVVNLEETGDRVILRIDHDGMPGFAIDIFPVENAIRSRVNSLHGDLTFPDDRDGLHSIQIEFSKF
jgi:two-component system CheB/CheR fusion protein